MARLNTLKPTTLLSQNQRKAYCCDDDIEHLIFIFRWPSAEAGAYTDLFRNLSAAIRAGADLAVKWSEATSVIEMIELAMKSSNNGVTVNVPNVT